MDLRISTDLRVPYFIQNLTSLMWFYLQTWCRTCSGNWEIRRKGTKHEVYIDSTFAPKKPPSPAFFSSSSTYVRVRTKVVCNLVLGVNEEGGWLQHYAYIRIHRSPFRSDQQNCLLCLPSTFTVPSRQNSQWSLNPFVKNPLEYVRLFIILFDLNENKFLFEV